MKPIEFMDALSDIQEEYIRQMLDETAAPDVSGKVGGAVNNVPITLKTDTGFLSDGRRSSESDKTFGGRLRYLALLASAAACIAGVAGIIHLHPGRNSDSMAADSVLNSLEIESGTAASALSEAAVTTAAPYTTEKQTAAGSGTTAVTTASGSAGTYSPETTAAAAAQAASVTEADSVQETTAPETAPAARSTETTAAETEYYTVTTTIPGCGSDMPSVEYDIPYHQPYLLGDVDADGDITLLDYFLARHAEHVYSESGRKYIEDAAADRANLYRMAINGDVYGSMDYLEIRDIAVYRAFLGRPDMTTQEIDRLWLDYSTYPGGDSAARVELSAVYDMTLPQDGPRTPGDVISGEAVPAPIRAFYNAAHEFLPEGGMVCDRWTDGEFEQKMDVLRTLLAQN